MTNLNTPAIVNSLADCKEQCDLADQYQAGGNLPGAELAMARVIDRLGKFETIPMNPAERQKLIDAAGR